MKTPEKPQSTTSLPRAPREEVDSRFKKYAITMGIRIACFILMVVVTPYGWYTWVFAVGAVFLPYVAVVLANVGQDSHIPGAVNPERAIEAPRPVPEQIAESTSSPVIRIAESPTPQAAPADPPAREDR